MEMKKYSMDMRTAMCDTLIELSQNNDRIVWLEADLMASSGMKNFMEKYPERFVNCGIQESNMAGVAGGLSAEGMIPFIHSFAAFSSRRIADQLFVSGVYARQNIRVIGSDPGISAGANGGTHMSLEDIGIMRSMPGTIILDPCDAVQQRQVLRQSVAKRGVYYIRLMRKSQTQFYDEDRIFEIGKASTLQDGTDLTVITCGTICLTETVKAAEILKERGVSVRIIDMFTIKPLDIDAVLRAARETKSILSVENHNIYNGLGSAVAEVLAESGISVPFKRLGAPDCAGEVGSAAYLMKKYGISCDDIVAAGTALLSK